MMDDWLLLLDDDLEKPDARDHEARVSYIIATTYTLEELRDALTAWLDELRA